MKNKKNIRFLFVCLLLLSLFTGAQYAENIDSWIIDILSHFPVQYALFAFILLVICLWKKTISLALFAGFLLAFNINVLLDFGKYAQAARQEYGTFKVYSANINKSNRNFSKLVPELMRSEADILLLLEITEKNIKPLTSLIQTYPYHVINLNVGFSGTGTILMSKFPILNYEITKYSEFGNMLISAMLELNNHKVIFYGTHFPRPTNILEFSARSMQITALARQISKQQLPVILAGDFNETPYSPVFKNLLKISGLRDSRTGFGWQPTWPTYFPLLWIPIDHILVSPNIQVHKRTSGSHIGSDHYPVLAELSIG